MTQMKLVMRAMALCLVAIAMSLFSATAIGAQEVPPVPTVPVVEVPPPAPATDMRGLPFNSGSGRRVV